MNTKQIIFTKKNTAEFLDWEFRPMDENSVECGAVYTHLLHNENFPIIVQFDRSKM